MHGGKFFLNRNKDMPSTSLSSQTVRHQRRRARRNHLSPALRHQRRRVLLAHEPVDGTIHDVDFTNCARISKTSRIRARAIGSDRLALSVKIFPMFPATNLTPRCAALEHQRHDQHRIAASFSPPAATSISRSQPRSRHARSVSRTQVNLLISTANWG